MADWYSPKPAPQSLWPREVSTSAARLEQRPSGSARSSIVVTAPAEPSPNEYQGSVTPSTAPLMGSSSCSTLNSSASPALQSTPGSERAGPPAQPSSSAAAQLSSSAAEQQPRRAARLTW